MTGLTLVCTMSCHYRPEYHLNAGEVIESYIPIMTGFILVHRVNLGMLTIPTGRQ